MARGRKGAEMKNDFENGKVSVNIIMQALPLMAAQFVHLLYNVVDRIYIGHMPVNGSLALTGVGLAFPITTLTAAFTNLFAYGGMPLFAMARGAGKHERAEKILSQTAGMLVYSSLILSVVFFLFRRQILYLFGASDASFVFADAYLRIYLFGTLFSMIATGLNGFINAQGYPQAGMMTIVIGAVINLILDPVLIFGLNMGVSGAALATVISQIVSAVWAVSFFFSKRSEYRIRTELMRPDPGILKETIPLGTAGFIMQGTNSLVQIICNVTLRAYGGDLYVGIMTVLNSVREILQLPANSISQGGQPVLSYNFGARRHSRVKAGIRFITIAGLIYTAAAWALVLLFPSQLMGIFTEDTAMIEAGRSSMILYFFGFVFMSFQSGGQVTFTAMNCSKRAIFFSLFRKVIIVVPLTLLLPRLGFGTDGVFLAEPVSNVLGGLACFITMYLTVYRKLPADGIEGTGLI